MNDLVSYFGYEYMITGSSYRKHEDKKWVYYESFLIYICYGPGQSYINLWDHTVVMC